jgi:hypothetical protein
MSDLHDTDFIAAYNTGEVHSAIAQRVYAADLSAPERALASTAFEKARPDLRERIKVFVFVIMYGMQATAIAAKLQLPKPRAEEERLQFPIRKPSHVRWRRKP